MQTKQILHLISHYLPPSQIWLYNLLSNTKSIQHHIATRAFSPQNFYHPNFRFTKSQIGFYYHHLKTVNKGAYRNKLEKLLLFPQKWIFPSEEKQWTKYIRDNNIQLIHAHFANFASEHLDWIKKINLPFVVSFYGYDYEKLPFTKPRFIKQYQELFHHADSILCEGPHGVQTLIQMGCPASKLHIVPLGIDMKEWQMMPPQTKKQDSLKLLQVANFTNKKGQLDTLKAAMIAKKSIPNLELTFIGSAKNNDYFNECMQLIQQEKNRDWIKYIPFVSYEILKSIIAEHDVFIHPSKYGADKDCEGGAPTILFNVQAMGMPVISTKHCDIPFVVKEKTSGLLANEGDVGELTKSIIYFYKLTESEFHIWQKNTFDWSNTSGRITTSASSLLTIYNDLIIS